MKRITLALVALALIMAIAGCGAPKQTFVNIASGGTGGTYYPSRAPWPTSGRTPSRA
jgi:TRAP-type uncharacterized transport system substrate-binding protein